MISGEAVWEGGREDRKEKKSNKNVVQVMVMSNYSLILQRALERHCITELEPP